MPGRGRGIRARMSSGGNGGDPSGGGGGGGGGGWGRGSGRPTSGRGARPVCNHFMRTGTCSFGGRCRYSHELPALGGDREWSHMQPDIDGEVVTAAANGAAALGTCATAPLSFTFMTYNVLADELARKHWAELYRDVPREVLAWSGRCGRLLAEIAAAAPDILALQEVDRLDDFQRSLSALGYEGRHLPRTGGRADGCATFWLRSKFELARAQDLRFCDHGLRDNVALLTQLWPRDSSAPVTPAARATAPPAGAAAAAPRQFDSFAGGAASQTWQPRQQQQQQQQRQRSAAAADGWQDSPWRDSVRLKGLEADSQSGPNASDSGSSAGPDPRAVNGTAAAGPQRSCPSANGAAENEAGGSPAAAAAAAAEAGRPPVLTVANTHILFNPKRGDVKLAQVRTLMQAVHHMAGGGPAIVAGDFNSQPGSAVHRFCADGRVALHAEDRRSMSGQEGCDSSGVLKAWNREELQLALGRASVHGDNGVATHPLHLRSAYQEVAGREPAFSTGHSTSFGTVDFIWHTPQAEGWNLQPTGVLQSPHPQVLAGGMPSLALPSDHIPLMAAYQLRPAAP